MGRVEVQVSKDQPASADLGVQDFLERFADALKRADVKAISALWEVPAFIIGEEFTANIEERGDLHELFAGAREHYRAAGVTDTRPEIIRLDEITDRLVMVRVRWPWLNEDGQALGAECSTYTLCRDSGGEWKIRVALMHGAEALN